MGFLARIFNRKKNEWKQIDQFEKAGELDFQENEVLFQGTHNEAAREQIVRMHLEKMQSAARELKLLEEEYNYVTNSLLDCDAIESFPQLEKEDLESIAKKIQNLDAQRLWDKKKERKITPSQFSNMERLEDEIPEGIQKLKDEEEYREKVKRDLVRLNAEKQAYLYRREELHIGIENAKGMAKICFVALLICFAILLVLKSAFRMDIQIGGLLAIATSAIAITLFFSRFLDYSGELTRVEKDMNRLTMLQNKVKIRYVNNINLLDYLYLKYGVNSASELEKIWGFYEKEKKEQKQMEQVRTELELLYKKLLHILTRNRIFDTSVWLHQTLAFVDPREMVEVRHGLNLRRQKLRDQMEYNNEVAKKSQIEIKKIVELYPKHAKNILDIVAEYEKNIEFS